RNLLIYFDRPTQAQAIRALGRLLAPDGLLFVGHAESQVAITAGYVSANFPRAFAFRAAPPPAAARPPRETLRMPPLLPPRVTFRAANLPPVTTRRLAPPPPAAVGPPKPPGLDAARTLADQGKLADAARLCEDRLRTDSADAAAWFLLGVVRDAAGDGGRAAECYAKTLYLQPNHEEALLARALLAEQTGDAITAAGLRRRLARVQGRSVTP
ncbi:MAG: methyltransferase, partial [Caulobacteraceae bacterium]|nr:methyltransferase [Caulobacter sp.]